MERNKEATAKTITCTYCHQQGTAKTMVQRPITQIRNGRVVKDRYWFCKDTPCGGHYQMGCEG